MAKRVLVVAGREGVAPTLQIQIELWGGLLDFTLAASANEALWEVRGAPYDMVLAPWDLPEMSGIEFAEVVQALSPATKLILLGAPVTASLQSRAKALGVHALLAEASPQDMAVLISRGLEVPLPRPRPAPEPEPPPRAEAPPRRPLARPAEPAAQPPPTPAPPSKGVLEPAQERAVRRALQDLLASVGPQVAALVSATGAVLAVEGSAGRLDLPTLASRAVSSLGVSDSVTELLGEEQLLGLSLFSGSHYDLYTFTISETALLLMVFDKTIVEGKLGSVWLYARRVVDDLKAALT